MNKFKLINKKYYTARDFNIKTITPVHIGSGDVYMSSEYFLDNVTIKDKKCYEPGELISNIVLEFGISNSLVINEYIVTIT